MCMCSIWDDALYLPLAEKVESARCLNNGEQVRV